MPRAGSLTCFIVLPLRIEPSIERVKVDIYPSGLIVKGYMDATSQYNVIVCIRYALNLKVLELKSRIYIRIDTPKLELILLLPHSDVTAFALPCYGLDVVVFFSWGERTIECTSSVKFIGLQMFY